MAKTSGEIEKEFIDNLKEATGKDLNEWLKDIAPAVWKKETT